MDLSCLHPYALRRTVVPNFYCCCLCSELVLCRKVIGKNEEEEEEKCAHVLRNEMGGSVFATDCTCTIQFIANEKGAKHENNVIYERERERENQTSPTVEIRTCVFFLLLFCAFACQDGMGKLRIVPKGIRLEGEAEFVRPLYVQEIKAEDVSNYVLSIHTKPFMPHIKSCTHL